MMDLRFRPFETAPKPRRVDVNPPSPQAGPRRSTTSNGRWSTSKARDIVIRGRDDSRPDPQRQLAITDARMGPTVAIGFASVHTDRCGMVQHVQSLAGQPAFYRADARGACGRWIGTEPPRRRSSTADSQRLPPRRLLSSGRRTTRLDSCGSLPDGLLPSWSDFSSAAVSTMRTCFCKVYRDAAKRLIRTREVRGSDGKLNRAKAFIEGCRMTAPSPSPPRGFLDLLPRGQAHRRAVRKPGVPSPVKAAAELLAAGHPVRAGIAGRKPGCVWSLVSQAQAGGRPKRRTDRRSPARRCPRGEIETLMADGAWRTIHEIGNRIGAQRFAFVMPSPGCRRPEEFDVGSGPAPDKLSGHWGSDCAEGQNETIRKVHGDTRALSGVREGLQQDAPSASDRRLVCPQCYTSIPHHHSATGEAGKTMTMMTEQQADRILARIKGARVEHARDLREAAMDDHRDAGLTVCVQALRRRARADDRRVGPPFRVCLTAEAESMKISRSTLDELHRLGAIDDDGSHDGRYIAGGYIQPDDSDDLAAKLKDLAAAFSPGPGRCTRPASSWETPAATGQGARCSGSAVRPRPSRSTARRGGRVHRGPRDGPEQRVESVPSDEWTRHRVPSCK